MSSAGDRHRQRPRHQLHTRPAAVAFIQKLHGGTVLVTKE
jgi:hypothetical protein